MSPLLSLLFAIQIGPGPQSAPYKQPQIAVSGNFAGIVFGSGNSVWFASSTDGGGSFGAPVKVGTVPALPLGMRRGPRIAISGNDVYIAAVSSTAKGQDGDVVLWRSGDQGKTWAGPKKLNDTPGSAREGFESISASGKRVFATWLDLRTKGMKLYGVVSTDGGATWGDNRLIYASPDGHICECCHTNTAIGPDGKLYSMWRNWLRGDRDMYLTVSTDEGRTWKPEKLGTGSWALNACPMDGGSLSIGPDGKVLTAWRRDTTVYLASPGQPEREIAKGKQPAAIATAKGPLVIWADGTALRMLAPGAAASTVFAPEGAFVSLAGNGPVLAAWEHNGAISVERISIR